jgi:vitamin B12 transporter
LRLRRRTLVALCFCAVAASPAWRPKQARADDETDRGGVDEVRVRGSQASGFTSRAKIEDAPREVTDAASLVEPLPGVHVRRLGADDSFTTLSIRGSSSSQVAVYLAGVPLTGGGDPTVDISTLPLWPGAQARVHRSFAPATLGPGSLGGTLVLEPPSAGAPVGSEVWASAGSFGALRMRAGDVRAFDWGGDARIVTAVSASRSDDDFSYYDDRLRSFTTRENAGHAAVNGLVSVTRPVQWTRASVGSVRFTTIAQARKQQLPGTLSSPTPNAQISTTRLIESMELRGPTGGGTGTWSVAAWGRRDDVALRPDHDQYVVGVTKSREASIAAGSSIGWRGRVHEAVGIETRAEVIADRFAPGDLEGGATSVAGARRVLGALATDMTWRPAKAWTFGASGRAEGWRDVVLGGTTAGEDRTEARPTGHIGAETSLGDFTFATHGGAVARSPSFTERFGTRGSFIPNPELRTESAWTIDAGARHAARVGKVRLRSELTGFGTWADDLIVFIPNGAFARQRAENIGRARVLGVEADLGLRYAGLDLRVAYTGMATTNLSECGAVTGGCVRPPLPGRPAHDVFGDLAYQLGPLRARYGIDVVAGMRADRTGSIDVPARALHSTGVRVDVPHVRGLRVALEIRNLFDLRVATYAGTLGDLRQGIGDSFDYPLPGRTMMLSVRWVEQAEP